MEAGLWHNNSYTFSPDHSHCFLIHMYLAATLQSASISVPHKITIIHFHTMHYSHLCPMKCHFILHLPSRFTTMQCATLPMTALHFSHCKKSSILNCKTWQRYRLTIRLARVVQNIDWFEKLSRYEYNAICLQYRDNQYDAMYRAITTNMQIYKLFTCTCIHNCLIQHSTKQFCLFSFQASRHSSQLWCCLLEGWGPLWLRPT